MTQVIRGLEYLHNYSEDECIAHFDLKPDNIMSTIDGVLKIADFGLAVALKGTCSSPYRATECVCLRVLCENSENTVTHGPCRYVAVFLLNIAENDR